MIVNYVCDLGSANVIRRKHWEKASTFAHCFVADCLLFSVVFEVKHSIFICYSN